MAGTMHHTQDKTKIRLNCISLLLPMHPHASQPWPQSPDINFHHTKARLAYPDSSASSLPKSLFSLPSLAKLLNPFNAIPPYSQSLRPNPIPSANLSIVKCESKVKASPEATKRKCPLEKCRPQTQYRTKRCLPIIPYCGRLLYTIKQ